jgi:hypothetical protein
VVLPLLLVVAAVGCGTVTSSHSDGGTGGTSGAAGAAGHSGSGGGSGHPGGGGQAGGGVVGGGGGGGAACLPYNATGFAYNVDNAYGADGGRCLPTDPKCCYADCQLNGAQFVGCAENATGTTHSRCYASCADCP